MLETPEVMDQDAILSISHLNVTFKTISGNVKALKDINLVLRRGETIGILGESGSGKSTLSMSIIGLLPENAKIEGDIVFNGKKIDYGNSEARHLNKRQRKMLSGNLQEIRWKEISVIFQGAMNSFNPVYTIDKQMQEVFRLHTNLSSEEIEQRIIDVLKVASLNPDIRKSYPHEFSGGMKQRAMIAMALSLNPKIVIADEPTTGLDVISQATIIGQLKKLKSEKTIESMIVISHDIGVVSALSDRVIVLYSGKIMEIGSRQDIFGNPLNPYTFALLDSYPSIKANKEYVRGIPGTLPDPTKDIKGCVFAGRCAFTESICYEQSPDLVEVEENHFSACHFGGKISDKFKTIRESNEKNPTVTEYKKLDKIATFTDLKKYYKIGRAVTSTIYSGGKQVERFAHAVDGVSFDLRKGEVTALIGESGSGKTTLGLTVILAVPPTSGEILYYPDSDSEGQLVNYKKVRNSGTISYRSKVQMIFQDPYDSLDPKMKVSDIVSEPLYKKNSNINRENVTQQIREALESANLSPPDRYLELYPHELSGGERQRVSLARSMISKPELIVADEPVSMLDVSIRANILNLLKGLSRVNSLTMLYISHDIASARYISDMVAIMYLGRIVEYGSTSAVISSPLHPYTKALIKAIPVPGEEWNPENLDIIGEVGNSINVYKGCRFYDRCVYRKDVCKEEDPPIIMDGEHWYACHFLPTNLVRNPREITDNNE